MTYIVMQLCQMRSVLDRFIEIGKKHKLIKKRRDRNFDLESHGFMKLTYVHTAVVCVLHQLGWICQFSRSILYAAFIHPIQSIHCSFDHYEQRG